MSMQALKAAATEGKNLKPMEKIKLKLEGLQKQLAQAIPQTMQKFLTPERQIRLFWQEARKNKKILECDPETIASSLMTASQLGIEIGVQGQGYIVPYYNNKKRSYDAQFIIGYKGLIGLARRSGEVQSIETHIVYTEDKFNLQLGIDTKIEHMPFLEGDRGAPRLVYGVARFKDGGHHFEWMSLSDVEKIRRKSKATTDSGPWSTDYEQMIRKTLIRRMSNYLPMSIEFANALTIDDAVSDGKKAALDGEFVEVEEIEDENIHQLTNASVGESIPETPGKVFKEKSESINIETGEVKIKQHMKDEAPVITHAIVEERLLKAEDKELLAVAADFIQELENEEQKQSLIKLYQKRYQELKK